MFRDIVLDIRCNHFTYSNNQIAQPSPQVILTCFAGRRRYMQVLLAYTQNLYEKGLIHQVHLWDFSRDPNDGTWLYENFVKTESPYIRVMSVENKHNWKEYYAHYTQQRYPDHVIIKCDDDIAYIDTDEFKDFIARAVRDDQYPVRFASVINNGVCAHLQQSLGLIPHDVVGDFPYDVFRGTLWNDGILCQRLHTYFTGHHDHWIETCRNFHEKTYVHPIGHRISINFFAICSKNLHVFEMVGYDDEYDISVALPVILGKSNAVDLGFTVAHIGFFCQRETGMDDQCVIDMYTKLAKRVLG